MTWNRPFDDPIPVPGGRQLVTLQDAADFIMRLTQAEQNHERWQTAIACLIGAAEGRDFMLHARVGMLRALNHAKPKPIAEARHKPTKTYKIVR
jgi:hypothetical protein